MNQSVLSRIGTLLFAAGLLAAVSPAAFGQMGDFKAEFKPNMAYTTTQVEIIEGQRGSEVMPSIESAQVIHIETGAEKGGAIPVKLTAYKPVKGRTGAMKDPVSVVQFEATTGGALRNFKHISGVSPMKDNPADLVTYQYLDGVLINPRYNLNYPNRRIIKVTSSKPAGGETKVVFTWDQKPTLDSEPNMDMRRTGTASFDSKALMYTSGEVVKNTTITVSADEYGDETLIKMKSILRYSTKISSK